MASNGFCYNARMFFVSNEAGVGEQNPYGESAWEASTGTRWRWQTLVLAAVIAGATFAAYSTAIGGGFIWDDDQYITDNPVIPAADGLKHIWVPGNTPQYYPLVFSMFWAEYRLWGTDATGYHVVNVTLHAISAVLVGLILTRLKLPGAWFAAAVFALHPVHVESAAWVTERKNVLSLVFYLLAMRAFLEFEDRRRWGWYAGSLAMFVLALLSKTVTCSLPVALLLIRWLRGKRWDLGYLGALVPFFAVGVVMGLLTARYEVEHVGAQGKDWMLGFADRIVLAGRALWFYPWKLTWPASLMFFYPRWEIDARDAVQWIWPAGAVAVGLAGWLMRKRWGRGPAVGLAFMAVTLFPALGFFDVYPFRYSFVADHFQYHASLGWIALVAGVAAWGLGGIVSDEKTRGVAGVCGSLVVCGVLGVLTWRQGTMYESAETLWRETIRRNPNAWMAYNNLAGILDKQGKSAEAIDLLRKSIGIKADFVEGHRSLGYLLQRTNMLDEAVVHYQAALKADPRDPQTLIHLAGAAMQANRPEEAERYYRQALQVDPGFANAYSALGNLLLMQRRYAEAGEHYRKAIAIRPGFAKDYYNLGAALRSQGKIEEAERMYRQALKFDPTYGKARSSLGSLLASQGRVAEAAAEFEKAARDPEATGVYSVWGQALVKGGQFGEALRVYQRGLTVRPQDMRLLQGLAWLRATCREQTFRDGAEALRIAEKLNQVTGNSSPDMLDLLAAALAEAGEFPQAAAAARRAVEAAGKAGRADLAKAISGRQKLYESGKAYRE